MGSWSRFLGALVKETTVTRDRRGRPESKPAGQRRYEEIMAYARKARLTEDRIGPPVRFTPDVNRWWYMVKGPQRWIRQQDKPGWHHGFYYVPGRWHPVVPPRDTWDTPRSYSGQPVRSGYLDRVPDPVLAAANLSAAERAGYRQWDGSARQEAKRTSTRAEEASTAAGALPTKRGVTTLRKRPGQPLDKATATRTDRRAPKRPTMTALTKKAATTRKKAR
jgi:hypothetical protein